jgi:hypothetical protein
MPPTKPREVLRVAMPDTVAQLVHILGYFEVDTDLVSVRHYNGALIFEEIPESAAEAS